MGAAGEAMAEMERGTGPGGTGLAIDSRRPTACRAVGACSSFMGELYGQTLRDPWRPLAPNGGAGGAFYRPRHAWRSGDRAGHTGTRPARAGDPHRADDGREPVTLGSRFRIRQPLLLPHELPEHARSPNRWCYRQIAR